MTRPVYFVSLGPGDPELITLKALNTLQSSDIIYCPGTYNKEGVLLSRSARIIEDLNIETRRSIFHIPMSKDRLKAIESYDTLCRKIHTDYLSGKLIAIVAEGDAGFYGSSQYLYDKLSILSIPVRKIAGIPAFIAAGALAGLHIVKQEEHLHIIPGKITEEELSSLVEKGYAIVIMKLSQCKEIIRKSISQYPQMSWHYFENIGFEDQFYTSDTEIILKKDFPYFSILVIKYAS